MRIMECLLQERLMWQVVIMRLIATGARRGGITGLKCKNIDFENGSIRIDCALLYDSKIGVYEETLKTRAGYHTIGVSGEAMSYCFGMGLSKTSRNCGSVPIGATDYLFTNETGRYLHACTFSSCSSNSAKKNGLSHINPHALRHTQASELL